MRLLISLLFILTATFNGLGQNIPEKSNPPRIVNDFANLLSPQEQMQLESKLRTYNDSTSSQIAIVTVASLDGYDASEYAFALGRKWGIGQKGKNNGVLILIKPKSGSERGQVFIATGYGMEGAVTDAQTSRITKQILIPAFQKGMYYQGLDAATTRIMQLASGEYKADKKGAGKVSPLTSLIVFAVILLIFVGLAAISRSKRFANQSSMYSSQGYRANNTTSSLPFWLLMMGMGSAMSNRNRYTNSGWNDFSGGGGFGGGSDFGGFGGGDFGGGGSGGSW